jgi:hypothetical protein
MSQDCADPIVKLPGKKNYIISFGIIQKAGFEPAPTENFEIVRLESKPTFY